MRGRSKWWAGTTEMRGVVEKGRGGVRVEVTPRCGGGRIARERSSIGRR